MRQAQLVVFCGTAESLGALPRHTVCRFSVRAFWFLTLLPLSFSAGCKLDAETLARTGDAAVAGGGAGGDSPITPLDPIQRPRGRVVVEEGRLLTDLGTSLRGAAVPVDIDWTLSSLELVESFAQQSGLNTLHIYAENWELTPGERVAEVDALVSLAREAGLYVVISRGGGPDGEDHSGNGWFDLNQVLAFWEIYAPRYANQPHVIYEIQNNPEISCRMPLLDTTIDLQKRAYELIRSHAPNTHVALLSLSSIPPPEVLEQAIDALEGSISWTNASVFMHSGIDCASDAEFAALLSSAQERGVALLVSQLPIDDWADDLRRFEQVELSWFHHQSFASEDDISALNQQTEAANLSWCPDQGSFPEEADKCLKP